VRELLLSIRATEAMVGLSTTFSWTHSKPIWMHLIISSFEMLLLINDGSIIFIAFPSLQLLHAYSSADNQNTIRLPINFYSNV
jgi:hypothetical protein